MAFPQIVDADTKSGTQASNSNSWTATYPTNIVAGDLLLLFLASDGAPGGINPDSGSWTNIASLNSNLAVAGWAWRKIASGSETGNFTIALTATEQGAWRCFRITGQYVSGTQNDYIASIGSSTGGSNAPDVGALNPANWDVEDTLWIAMCALDTSRTVTTYPFTGRNTADVSGGSTGATLGLCTKLEAVASQDAPAWLISASDDWVAYTFAVRPAAAAAATPSFPPDPELRKMHRMATILR